MSAKKNNTHNASATSVQQDKEKTNYIWEYVKEHLEIITIAATIVSAFANAVFKFGSYIYSMGVYDYWNIPHDYIESNMEDLLFRFILYASIGIVLFIIATIYIRFIKKRIQYKSKLRVAFIYAIYFVLVTIVVGLLCVVVIAIYSSFKEAFLYVTLFPVLYLKQTIILSFLIQVLFGGMGSIGNEILSLEKKDISIKEVSCKKIGFYGFCIVLIIFAIAGEFWFIYNCGKDNAESSNEVTIATWQEKEYVVISKYKDKLIVKECISNESDKEISMLSYMFLDLEGLPLYIRHLSNDELATTHMPEESFQQIEVSTIKERGEEVSMNEFIRWCNQNQGLLSAILSFLALLLSVLTIIMTYRLGKMPFRKKLTIIPVLYSEAGEFYINLTLINSGNATICIDNIRIFNNDMLNIGMPNKWEYLTLKPCDYCCKKIHIYDDLENIKKNQLNLNGHIIIIVNDIDGRRYKASKGFPVG